MRSFWFRETLSTVKHSIGVHTMEAQLPLTHALEDVSRSFPLRARVAHPTPTTADAGRVLEVVFRLSNELQPVGPVALLKLILTSIL
jgi:hypothetical protein